MRQDILKDIFRNVQSKILPDAKVKVWYKDTCFTASKATYQVEQVFDLNGEAPEYAFSILADADALVDMPKQNKRVKIDSIEYYVIKIQPDPLGALIRYDLGYKYH